MAVDLKDLPFFWGEYMCPHKFF